LFSILLANAGSPMLEYNAGVRIWMNIFVVSVCAAADWLSFRGDADGSSWQKRESALNVTNVAGMKLLWKRPLRKGLTAPVMLGPIITHRGIKELVFVAAASDDVYAVDADLGRIFWERHLETSSAGCGDGLTAAPVIAPEPGKPVDDGEGHNPMRPIYVLASDGALHRVSPSTGADLGAAIPFVPPGAMVRYLTLTGKTVSAISAGGCAGARDGLWSVEVNGGKARFSSGKRDVGLETRWEGGWVYSVTDGRVRASRNGAVMWSHEIVKPLPPVVANGILFVLDEHARLYALDARTGRELFSSEALGRVSAGEGLAVANGHVCFGDRDGTLYCFGLPIETVEN
jgi:outer membrane protein assembly factor BamB